jgi:hypothetical protein
MPSRSMERCPEPSPSTSVVATVSCASLLSRPRAPKPSPPPCALFGYCKFVADDLTALANRAVPSFTLADEN